MRISWKARQPDVSTALRDQTDITLKHWRSVPFSWSTGEDCLMSIADHVLRCTGRDFGASWRDTYCTELGAYSHIADAGGEMAMIDASGLPAIDMPERGDIMLLGREKPIAALCTGNGAAMRLIRGVIEIDLRFVAIIKAWKVPQCLL